MKGQCPQSPVLFVLDVAEVEATSRTALVESQETIDTLCRTPLDDATFGTVAVKLADLDNQLQLTSNFIELLSKVATDASLREACHKAIDEHAASKNARYSRKDLAKLVDAVYARWQSGGEPQLDEEDTKLMTDTRRAFQQNGILMDDADAAELADVQQKIRQLEREFASNLDTDDHALYLDTEEIEGVPEVMLQRLQEDNGHYRVPLGGPDYAAILKFAVRAETREKLYRANVARGKNNVSIMEQVLRLRQQKARLLGHRTHSELVLQTKMAKSTERVQSFLDQVKDRVDEQIQAELAELRRLRSNMIGDSASDMALWDLPYYTRLYRSERTHLNEAEVSEYFPLVRTLANMLKLFGHLFGLAFKQIDATVAARLVWHEDVTVYSVWNTPEEGGDFVGYLYLDLYSRSGKSGMPHCHPLQAGYVKPDGSRHYPSTVLITSFEPLAADGHRLLQHSEVVLVFHELGHGIHDLVGKCKYSRYHGAETAADFNEAPSQMLEEWCWNPVGLQQLSSHYITKEIMPDAVIEALAQSRHMAPMVSLLPQLRITLFDNAVHSSTGEVGPDLGNVYKSCLQIEGIEDVDEEFGYGTFRHLMNGNDGCMYSYLWSKAIAQDMFDTMFKDDPICSTTGRRYRHLVLEKGGSSDETQLVTAFLGRSCKLDGFLASST
ncbi:hypothetical protein BDZ85DRAFT_261503 [Elsinoe ampelina]|uniref:Peptidase M3A/M3B catalytic domain-containing protein n=1 Tax=Elsinoe ampelina TaxID=302913 RepID=A0A6A6GCE3_9PEZI|nr:hypothetical protein BDZ85DRAFT_261503 [Elsinoe ampelina]